MQKKYSPFEKIVLLISLLFVSPFILFWTLWIIFYPISDERMSALAVKIHAPSICHVLKYSFTEGMREWPFFGFRDNAIEHCLQNYALVNEDPEICYKPTAHPDNCFFDYATEKKDIAWCDVLQNFYTRIACYTNFSGIDAPITGSMWLHPDQVSGMQIEHCNKLENIEHRGRCYRFIAERDNSAHETCSLLSEGTARDICLLAALNQNGGIHICQQIQSKFYSNACIESVSHSYSSFFCDPAVYDFCEKK